MVNLLLVQSRDSGFGIRNSDFEIRDAGLGTRDSGLGIRDSGLGIRDSEFGIRDSEFGIRDSGIPASGSIGSCSPSRISVNAASYLSSADSPAISGVRG